MEPSDCGTLVKEAEISAIALDRREFAAPCGVGRTGAALEHVVAFKPALVGRFVVLSRKRAGRIPTGDPWGYTRAPHPYSAGAGPGDSYGADVVRRSDPDTCAPQAASSCTAATAPTERSTVRLALESMA
jgi:hypothetical protein